MSKQTPIIPRTPTTTAIGNQIGDKTHHHDQSMYPVSFSPIKRTDSNSKKNLNPRMFCLFVDIFYWVNAFGYSLLNIGSLYWRAERLWYDRNIWFGILFLKCSCLPHRVHRSMKPSFVTTTNLKSCKYPLRHRLFLWYRFESMFFFYCVVQWYLWITGNDTFYT